MGDESGKFSNNMLQRTLAPHRSLNDKLSPNGLEVHHGSLPVMRARCWRLNPGVSPARLEHLRDEGTRTPTRKTIPVFAPRDITGRTDKPGQISRGVGRSRIWGVEVAWPPLAGVPWDSDPASGARRRGTAI